MMFFILPMIMLFALESSSSTIDVVVHSDSPDGLFAFELDQGVHPLSPSELHLQMLTGEYNNQIYRSHLSGFSKAINYDLKFVEKTTHVGSMAITRVTPQINGIDVEGADGIYSRGFGRAKFAYTHFIPPTGRFSLSAAEGLEEAMGYSISSTLKNPYVEKVGGLYQ